MKDWKWNLYHIGMFGGYILGILLYPLNVFIAVLCLCISGYCYLKTY